MTVEDFEKFPKFQNFALKILPLIDEWATAYSVPASEIIRQFPFAHSWMLANPKRAPKKDIVRFLNSWMRKADQMGNLIANRSPIKPRPSLLDATHVEDMTQEELVRIREQNFPSHRGSSGV